MVQTIRDNPQNRLFFEANTFFEDQHYNILTLPDRTLFAVKHKGGVAYYELNGSIIGNYTQLTK